MNSTQKENLDSATNRNEANEQVSKNFARNDYIAPGDEAQDNDPPNAVLAAIPRHERKGRVYSSCHIYRDANGAPIFYKPRLDPVEGSNLSKWMRPVSWDGTQYVLKEPKSNGPLPLFNLPEILCRAEETVWVVEGEKCADHLMAKGILATTSGASNTAGRHDWSPLESRKVIVWPDNDGPGYRYAEKVSSYLNDAEFVNVAHLGLGEGDDAADYTGTVETIQTTSDLAKASGGQWQPKAPAKIKRSQGKGLPGWVNRALEYIPCDVGRDEWLKVGMAIHHADPSDTGFKLWESWSKGAEYPDQDEALARNWASFSDNEQAPVTLGTLRRLARNHGWEPGPGERIKNKILARLLTECGLNSTSDNFETVGDSTYINAGTIDRIIGETFWSPEKGRLFLVNEEGALIQATQGDVADFTFRRFGYFFISDYDEQLAAAKSKLSVFEIVMSEIVGHIRYYNQRSRLSWLSDMFAEQDRITFDRFSAVVNLKHRPYAENEFDQRIVDDFSEHFPQFQEVVEWIVDARFASDRKHCYLWLKADSDFGKGLLTNTLAKLGAAAKLDEVEAERAASGQPLGKEPQTFVSAAAVVFNEVTKVTPAIKTLESEMELSPKNQLTASVAVYAKILTSSYPINSLVTDAGVEDQLSNRFCYLEGCGSVKVRRLFLDVGRNKYAWSLRGYIAKTMNDRIRAYQGMGRESATEKADQLTDKFFEKYQVSKTFGRVSDNASAVAEEFLNWLIRSAQTNKALTENMRLQTVVIDGKDSHRFFLRSPKAWFRCYLEDSVPKPAQVTLSQAEEAIFKALSYGGKGAGTYRCRGNNETKTRSAKGLPLKAKQELEQRDKAA